MVSTPLLRRSLGVKVITLPSSPSVARSLLVSSDPTTIEQITDAMERLAVATEVCVDVASALQILNTKKFDAVMVDFDLGDNAPGVLGEMRQSPSNRTAPTMAIIRSKSELALAYCAGSNFVLERPLSAQSLDRTLSVGYGLIVRERRRYFRCKVKTRVSLRRVDMRQAQSHTVNISEGGMEITAAPGALVPGKRVHAEFTLPGRMGKLTSACEIAWRDKRGHVGLRFRLLPLEQRCDLQEWLAEQLEKSMPEAVAERFRQATDRFRLE
jgi:ActR/RegA family two-component response regulator